MELTRRMAEISTPVCRLRSKTGTSATIIGYVGEGGLGLLLRTYQEFYAWDTFAAILLMISLVVCALDGLSTWADGASRDKTGRKRGRPFLRKDA